MRKNCWIVMLFFIFAVSSGSAQQKEVIMPNMIVPSGLDSNSMYFELDHRLYYDLLNTLPTDDVFSPLNSGANIQLAVRYMIAYGIEVDAAYMTLGREKRIGAGYSLELVKNVLHTKLAIQYFSADTPLPDQFQQNLYYLISIQSHRLWNIVTVTVNSAYDGYERASGFGTGVNIQPIENITLMAEYYPVLTETIENRNNKNIYFIGIGAKTYGHQFILMIGNSYFMSTRRLMLGTPAEAVHIGFKIQRLFTF